VTSLYGTVTLGRLPALFEAFEVTQGVDGLLGVSVQASSTALSTARVERLRDDLLGLPGKLIPVVWSDKVFLGGFYTVSSVDVKHWSYPGLAAAGTRRVFGSADVRLKAGGYANTADIESRLSGAQTRSNDFSGTGEIWHAPPIGHSGYLAGTAVPTAVTRTGEDGAVVVYRGLAFGANPRWGATTSTYPQGRVRFIDSNAEERSGQGVALSPVGWVLSNGLVRITPLVTGGVFSVDAYTGGAWRAKAWDVLDNAATITPVDGVDILQNDYETVVVRLYKGQSQGRVTVDLTLRRGSRFVELFVQSDTSATLKIVKAATEAGTNATAGMVIASSNDADGNKYVVGSSKSFTADTAIGGVSKASVTALDAFVGVVAGGTGAVTGDQAANLFAQYLGSSTEVVAAVRR
jgi:hypothetical protein